VWARVAILDTVSGHDYPRKDGGTYKLSGSGQDAGSSRHSLREELYARPRNVARSLLSQSF